MRRRLTVYDLAPGPCSPFDAAAARYVFVVDGTVRLDTPDGSAVVSFDHGAPIPADADLVVDGTAWLCESAPAEAALADPTLASVVLSKSFDFPEASQALFRVDRIDLAAGARTPVHFHRGPGIRRLLSGRVRVAIGDDVLGVGPGGAWFEPGDEPVLGENVADGDSAFLRVSLLPIELIGGKSSFRPASEAEAAKPRAVGQGLLYEQAIALD